MKRLFLAVDLSIAVVERLVLLQDELQRRVSKLESDVQLRWTDAANIHLTLKFLGEVDAPIIPMISTTMEKLVAPLFPFEVECRSFGCFPKPESPRILWSGLDSKGAEVLGLLQQAIERDLTEIGIEAEERDFRPHVTLGRVKSRAAPNFTALVDEFSELRLGKSYIKDIILYESHLDHRGPRYQVIERYPLGSS